MEFDLYYLLRSNCYLLNGVETFRSGFCPIVFRPIMPAIFGSPVWTGDPNAVSGRSLLWVTFLVTFKPRKHIETLKYSLYNNAFFY